MRSVVLLLLVVAIQAVAEETKDGEVKNALKKLEGTWVVDSAVDSKEGVGSEVGWEWLFAEGKVIRQNPRDGETQKFTGKTDPTATPAALDLIADDDRFVHSCIYEIKDNTLRICIGRSGGRPTEFTDEKGFCLVTLKRAKR